MNKKSLLLLIPFAAAALAGCTPAVKPCDEAVINFKQTSLTIGINEQQALPYEIEGGSCSGELKFNVADPTVAKVDLVEGVYKVTGLKEGTTEITCNGKTFTVYVQKEAPDPTKEVIEVLSVKSAPTQVGVGKTIKADLVTLNVKLSDGTESTAKATKVECNTSVAVDSVEATAWYREVGSAKFNIKVVDSPTPVGEGNIYLFNNTFGEGKNFSDISEEAFLGTLVTEGEDIIKGYKDASNAYIGGNGGNEADGSNWTLLNCLKVGKSKAKGTITLKLDSAIAYSSIKVKAIGSRDDGELTINGVTKAIPKKAIKADLEPIEVEFEVASGAAELVLSNKDSDQGNFAIMITSIEFVKGDTPTPTKEVKSIEITGTPKTAYKEGEAYSAEGLSVVATFTDETTGTVSATISPDKAKAAVGDTKVTFSATYGGKTATKEVTVTVEAKPAPVAVDVSYRFESLTKKDTPAMTADEAKAAFVSGIVSGTDVVSAAEPSNSYAYDKALRVGSGKGGGTFEITTSSIVTKIVLSAHAYNGTEFNDITIGSKTVTVTAEEADYEFDLSETNKVTISTNKRVLIDGIGFCVKGVTPQKQLTSLSIKTPASKLEYNEGESFSAAGLVLHAVYSDSSEEDITSGWTISPAGPLAATDNKVVVSYGGKSVDIGITVTARELLSIAITSGMTTTSYKVGENWNTAGIVVTGTYNIGDPTPIDASKYNLTLNPTAPALGVNSVSIIASMKDGSKTSEAYVQTGISVSEAPADPVIGQTFTKVSSTTDLTEGTYILVHKDGYVFNGEDAAKSCATVAELGDSVVGAAGMAGIEIKSMTGGYSLKVLNGTNAGSYMYGAENSNALKFGAEAQLNTIEVSDGEATIVSNTSTIRFNTDASQLRFRYIKSSSTSGDLPMLYKAGSPAPAKTVDHITVSGTYKTDYSVGESFDPAGMIVTAYYVEGGSDVVTNYTISPNGALATTDTKVVVTYGQKTADVAINVTNPTYTVTSISVKSAPSKTTYTEGETFDPAGMVISVVYSDSSHNQDITSGFTVSPSGALAEGTSSVTISYTFGDKTVTTTQAITVNKASGEKGTETNPYNIADLWTDVCSKLTTTDAWSEKSVYVSAVVMSIDAGTPSLVLGDNTSTNTLIVYKPASIEGIMVGDTILVHSYVELFQNKYEMTGYNTYPVPVIDKITKGTVSVVVDASSSANATVNLSGGNTAVNGSTYTFTVSVNSGYELVSVKVYGQEITATSGNSYSFSVNGAASILVTTKQQGAADPEVYKSCTFLHTNKTAGDGASGYTSDIVYTFTENGFAVTTTGANDNNTNTAWDFLKMGSKSNDATATFTTDSAIDKAITAVVLNFKAIGNITSAKVLVSSNSSFTNADEYSFTPAVGDTTVAITNAKTNCYYKVVIELSKASSNGPASINSIAYWIN